jgi:hypothetical protein
MILILRSKEHIRFFPNFFIKFVSSFAWWLYENSVCTGYYKTKNLINTMCNDGDVKTLCNVGLK